MSYMVTCGIHSGFPACCVRFYVTKFTWMRDKNKRIYIGRIQAAEKTQDVCWGYIPCHSCIRKGIAVKVLQCPIDSHCFYVDEALDAVPTQHTRETDRPIANQLKSRVSTIAAGLDMLRRGGAPNGSLADAMTRNVDSMIEIIDRATH